MKFNQGKFIGDKYIKRVNFSKAVLWKDRQISLHPAIVRQFGERGTAFVIFEDKQKNERWTASVSELQAVETLKMEGQEQQFYYPISVYKVSKIQEDRKPILVNEISEGEVVSSETQSKLL